MPGLERVTFVEAAINCIIRLEGEADTLARLLSEALQLAAASSDPRWAAWRADLESVRAQQERSSDRW